MRKQFYPRSIGRLKSISAKLAIQGLLGRSYFSKKQLLTILKLSQR